MIYGAFGNNTLSTVVRTQKRRCAIIPKRNKTANIIQKGCFIAYEIKTAARIVITTSTIARFMNR